MGHELGPPAHQVILNGLVGVISEGYEAFFAPPLPKSRTYPGRVMSLPSPSVRVSSLCTSSISALSISLTRAPVAYREFKGMARFRRPMGSVSIRHG